MSEKELTEEELEKAAGGRKTTKASKPLQSAEGEAKPVREGGGHLGQPGSA